MSWTPTSGGSASFRRGRNSVANAMRIYQRRMLHCNATRGQSQMCWISQAPVSPPQRPRAALRVMRGRSCSLVKNEPIRRHARLVEKTSLDLLGFS
jgi:hypothetical protein